MTLEKKTGVGCGLVPVLPDAVDMLCFTRLLSSWDMAYEQCPFAGAMIMVIPQMLSLLSLTRSRTP
jgi:hypothetical protein